MNKLLDRLSISTSICLNSSKALEQLAEGSTDLVIVDWEDDSAEFVDTMRKLSGWHKPAVVAVSPTDCRATGADFVLYKPVSDESGARTLKAAYSRMLYDYRRHTRFAVMSTVSATNEKGRGVNLTVLNVGDGGVGLSTKEEIKAGDTLSFSLPLPATDRSIYIHARVQWTRPYGAAGCEFLHIPPPDLNILHGWLTSRNQIKKPILRHDKIS
jgi:CheY-like chemotaxis protein